MDRPDAGALSCMERDSRSLTAAFHRCRSAVQGRVRAGGRLAVSEASVAGALACYTKAGAAVWNSGVAASLTTSVSDIGDGARSLVRRRLVSSVQGKERQRANRRSLSGCSSAPTTYCASSASPRVRVAAAKPAARRGYKRDSSAVRQAQGYLRWRGRYERRCIRVSRRPTARRGERRAPIGGGSRPA